MEPIKIGDYVRIKNKPKDLYLVRNMVTHKPLFGGKETFEYEIVTFDETKPILHVFGSELIIDSPVNK